MLLPLRFRFLNEEHSITSREDWDRSSVSKLWRYNLHYFEDLNAEKATTRSHWHREYIDRWIMENPPGQGTGWESYPTSLRIVSWIKWSLRGNTLEPAWRHNLAVQARWLAARMETHLLGNHLLANAKALIFAGVFFDGPEALQWRERGMTVIARELPVQILADGGHFERSPMYHALATEDLLDLINLASACPEAIAPQWREFVVSWSDTVRRMLVWLDAMSHPDGEISFFNDAAFGVAATIASLKHYFRTVTGVNAKARSGIEKSDSAALRAVHLQESGYIRINFENAAMLIDVAPVGPDFLPAHAHADTLSFELSVHGQRGVVNGGTSRYGTGHERQFERGTPAHSTVTIDGENSTEVWASFRVARRAYPRQLTMDQNGDEIIIHCAHDGYQRLSGRPVHHRTWVSRPASVCIEDEITGKHDNAVARFHLHPAIECESSGKMGSGFLKLPAGEILRWQVSGGLAEIEHSQYCHEFGQCLSSHCIKVTGEDDTKMQFELFW